MMGKWTKKKKLKSNNYLNLTKLWLSKLNFVCFFFINNYFIEYENAFISFLTRVSMKQADLVKKVLLEMPKKLILNFENPLLMSDFLTHYLS